jgi:hypothetical protein
MCLFLCAGSPHQPGTITISNPITPPRIVTPREVFDCQPDATS